MPSPALSSASAVGWREGQALELGNCLAELGGHLTGGEAR
jgi:hypothetical protein